LPGCAAGVEETEKILWDLAVIGTVCVQKVNGVDDYWLELWVRSHGD
jgi:hypothetical protein